MAEAASKKGASFLAEANKALNRTTIFGFGKAQKYEDAADNFTKAGNSFKLANQWQSAGEAYLKAGECHILKGDGQTDACNSYVEAGNSFKRINPVDSINAFKLAIDLYNENGRFTMSARYYKEVAEIFESDNNIAGAIENYQAAADLYIGDNKKSTASQCLVKIATMASLDNQFLRAAGIFESVGRESMESNLGKFSAKGYFFQAGLCLLAAGDAVAARMKLEEFKGVDYSLGSSREGGLLDQLIQATEGMDSDSFSQACADYDRISPLDPWKTSMLLKAKMHIPGAEGDGGAKEEEEEPDIA